MRKIVEHLLTLAASVLALWLVVNGDSPSLTQWLLAGIVAAALLVVFRGAYAGRNTVSKDKAKPQTLTTAMFRVGVYLVIGVIVAIALVDFGIDEFLDRNAWLPLGILGFIAIASLVAMYSVTRVQDDK